MQFIFEQRVSLFLFCSQKVMVRSMSK
uniref:Uncharacterized protein n=1 Tax=Arundo donax TaxID=35708 RepID=A0A0A9BTS0_ARUDO